MKFRGLLFVSTLFIFLLGRPSVVFAQPDVRIKRVVQEAISLFETRGFDPEVFPIGKFSPNEQDPMIFYLAWSSVKGDLELLLAKSFELEKHDVHLTPFLVRDLDDRYCYSEASAGLFRRRPGRLVFILGKRHRRTMSRFEESPNHHFIFARQPEPVRWVLKNLLPISDQDFWGIVQKERMFKLSSNQFLPRFRNDRDEIVPGEVERALLALIQNDIGPVKNLGLSPTAAVREHGIRITTSWVVAGGQRKSTKGRYYWRLNIGVEKSGPGERVWKLSVAINLGYRPYSESDPNKTKWLGDASLYGGSEILTAGPIQVETSARGTLQAIEKLQGEDHVQGNVSEPAERSSLAAIARMVFEKCQIKLCGRVAQ
jgi:hypothetical protein